MPRRSPMLKSLRSAEPSEILEAIAPLTEEQRIQLALYCYNRSHVRELRLRVAATIDAARLAALGGTTGQAIAAQSRATGLSFGTEAIVDPQKKPERKISLGGRGCVER